VSLVPVPWQPDLYLTPDTLALLVAAGNRLGTKLYIYQSKDGPTDGAWRSLARQEYLWRKALAGGNVASNPYSGQRAHMRGAAFDLVRSDNATQAACRAVGLVRDGVESWHWNNPRWASMPIIPANLWTASTKATVITPDPLEPTVFLIRNSALGDFLVAPGYCRHIMNANVTNEIARDLGLTIHIVKDEQINNTLGAFGITNIPRNDSTFRA